MKKTFIAFCMLLAGSIAAPAQCDKNVRLTASKTEYLDSALTLQKTEDEKSVIELSGKEVMIAPGNSDHKMTGTILSDTCNWAVPFKEGKWIIKARLSDNEGEKNITLTLEGKDGKVTLLFEAAEMPGRIIRVPVDTFEEKK